MKPRVAVLLATFNGMRWIGEQMQSILEQRGVDLTVFVSDDQSSDGTLEWCLERADGDARIVVLPVLAERFGGAARNFFRLIRDVDFSGFDYISFADQDDVWLPDKLFRAHTLMAAESAPAYSGNVVAFWPDGRERLIEKAQPLRRFDFLFEAGGPGCSYVLRVSEASTFKGFLTEHWEQARNVALHDWLIYAWYRSQGYRWILDPIPKMRYRQHEGNQVGANNGISAIIKRLQKIRSGWYRDECSKIAGLVAPDLPEGVHVLTLNGSISKRFIMQNFRDVRRRWCDRVVLFMAVLVGIY